VNFAQLAQVVVDIVGRIGPPYCREDGVLFAV